ncbi:N-acyl-phosphatidylethanolamine-hydrolyzing phospholipase D, (NapE-hydrolyzing phospholipased) (NapE-pld) [Thermovibrio ammonificans HB-1]|uniref:N-acyl-phosphatidylethanolamine-hydrolyzing phospholipase D, (NapE-hydrolyzing phospholipased) (NapE-pld) n=1 Tax=Thermovibrio ammonificans (strain DSM 15698 / JCM 12110 / HB-1) TaxID=648996 RepID=E8T2F1_THEA1|nr:N-acyl-phosphatidylethanolamine-hydrolyzing phospholipase D, (NapE-hydrolyzing phospholipased) (NapE-pld) [Thermovibrio ammonificans HB-1]
MNSMTLQIENLGHSTFTVKIGSLEVLTDPFLTECAGGIKRAVPAAKRPEEVTPKVVIVSHAHYDHLDLKTVKRLKGKPVYLTPENCKKVIKREEVIELKNFESVEIEGVRFWKVPAHHNRGRNLLHPDTGVGGFVIEHGGVTVYFAGDTAFSEHLYSSIGEKFKIDVAMLPIGGFFPVFRKFHQTPEEAVKGFKILKARRLVPIHFGSWHLIPLFLRLERALERLMACSLTSGITDRVTVIQPGERVTFDI